MSYHNSAPYPPTSHPYAAPTPPHQPTPAPAHSPYPLQPAHYTQQQPYPSQFQPPQPQPQPQPSPPAQGGYPPGPSAPQPQLTQQPPQQSPQQFAYPQYPAAQTQHQPHPYPPPHGVDPAAAAAEERYRAELSAYRRQLAEYYYNFAVQGQLAPAQGEEQVNARTQAVEWAKARGVVFAATAATGAGPVPPPRRVSLPVTSSTQQQSQAGPSQPPIQYNNGQSHTQPLPPPPRTGSAPIRPPSAPTLPTRPMSTGVESNSSGRGSPALPNPPQGARSFTPTGQRGPLPVRPNSVSARPGLPPVPASPARKPSLPAINLPADDPLAHVTGRMAAVTIEPEAQSAPPAVPSFSFAGPDDPPEPPARVESPQPTAPAIEFSVDPPPPAVPISTPTPPVPSVQPHPAAHAQYHSQYTPHPQHHSHAHSSQPRIHPRDDPSHPSHPLYHPAARLPALQGGAVEAGTVACRACREPLFGRVITTLGESWHPACFVCMEEGCGQNLEHVQFDGKDGAVYCMVHFEERYARTCYQCKTPIADPDYLTLSDPSLPPEPRYYHALHFFCSQCGDPFVDPSSLSKGEQHTLARPYMVHKGFAYCEQCEVRMFRDKCTACGEGIGGEYTEAGEGGMYHPECFNCTDCAQPLTGQYLLRIPAPDEVPQTPSPKKPNALFARKKKAEPEPKPYCHACFERRALETAELRAREAVRG